MKISLIPKRKLAQQEAGTIAPSPSSLEYYADVTEGKLATTAPATDLSTHEADTTTHGATGAVVGTTNTQTLTNKTLTTPALTNPSINSAGTITGLGTGANGFVLKNPKNSAASALSGTQLDITIDIGGVPYYFTIFPAGHTTSALRSRFRRRCNRRFPYHYKQVRQYRYAPTWYFRQTLTRTRQR